jgi:uncharacterized protein (TIGR02466 family)
VNGPAWAELSGQRLQVGIVGAWFQISNDFASHQLHNHGNCSWSGVYYVQCDPEERRIAHPRLGAANGLTRFHGPYLDRLGGAHMDLGAAYLQDSHVDVAPVPGAVVVWPSWLLHQALPYEGERDRIVISFNARIHGADGDQLRPYGF